MSLLMTLNSSCQMLHLLTVPFQTFIHSPICLAMRIGGTVFDGVLQGSETLDGH